MYITNVLYSLLVTLCTCITSAPPAPTEVTIRFVSASSVRVAWQWTSSDPGPNCFNTTTVTYHPEGGGEFFLQLSDPAATEATLTGFQCNTSYIITVVATAGEHKRESVAMTVYIPLQSMWHAWGWSHGGVLMCVDLVRVHYRPEGGSQIMHTVREQYNSDQCQLAQPAVQHKVHHLGSY